MSQFSILKRAALSLSLAGLASSVFALGSPDVDFHSATPRFENFEDEYGLGYIANLVSTRAIIRGDSSDTYLVAYSVSDTDMVGQFRLGMARYFLDGSRDPSFGSGVGVDGLRLLGYPDQGSRFYAGDVIEEATSGLTVSGSVASVDIPGDADTVVCRVTAAGTFDISWAADATPAGCRRLPALSESNNYKFAELVSDGAGGVYAATNVGAVVRVQHLDASGNVDMGYGIGGVFTVQPPGSVEANVYDLVVDSSGRLLVLGDTGTDDMNGTNFDWFVLRVLANGAEDQTFGTLNGYRRIGFDLGGNNARYDWPTALLEDGDGSLLIAGNVQASLTGYAVALIKLDSDGLVVDPNFGTSNGGPISYTQVSTSSLVTGMGRLPDGGVILIGDHELNFDNTDLDPAMMVFGSNGELDGRFWNSGVTVIPMDRTSAPGTHGRDYLQTLFVDADKERVVLGGRAEGGVDGEWQGMLQAIALHDRLFKDGLEDQ
ncbi:MAG TPA: hypothetical protein PLX09_00840 [Xanthomonadaceae bacterium]|nr:hypothetical protein [Xanthomonadaceae bacterium]